MHLISTRPSRKQRRSCASFLRLRSSDERTCASEARLPNRKQEAFNGEEFLGFAKSYLSQAFPNPQRIHCPPDPDLQRMAEHPIPERDDEVSNHLTCCSPCFNRYMGILADLKRKAG